VAAGRHPASPVDGKAGCEVAVSAAISAFGAVFDVAGPAVGAELDGEFLPYFFGLRVKV
jgi:hypothetical protein